MLNTSEKFYLLPQRGEDFYYACLGVKPDEKHRVQVIHAFWRFIIDMAEEAKTPEIIFQKLGWCRTDLDKIYSSLDSVAPEHPIFQALKPIVYTCHIRQSQLAAMIEAAQLTLSTHLFETQASLNQHYQHLGGLRLSLMAQALQQKPLDAPLEKTLHHLGIASEIVRHLQHFKLHLAHQHLYLPLDSFPEGETGAYRFLSDPAPSSELHTQFTLQADLAQQLFETHFSELPEDSLFLPISREIRLQRKLLGVLIKKDFPVLNSQILELSPIKKIWVVM